MKLKLYLVLLFAIIQGHVCFAQSLVKNMSSANGDVYSVYKSGSGYYIGGNFNYVGLNTGYAALTTATNDYPDMNFPGINGNVYAIIPDGNGGWYVGGSFSSVGGTPRSNIVRIKADRTVDASFSAACNSTVYGLALLGNKLYIGGSFTSVNGTIRNYAAAVNSGSGSLVSAWDPSLNSTVRSVTVVTGTDTTIWLGGYFTTVNAGIYRPYLVKVNNTNGNVINGAPNANNVVYTLVTKKDSLFVGGAFTELGLRTDYLSSIQEGNGLAGQNIPNTNSYVRSVIPDGSGGWYAAGDFTVIGGVNRSYIAHILSNNTVDPNFNVSANGSIYSVVKDGSKLYIGGFFNSINSTARNYIAAINASTGALQNWDPNANGGVRTLALKDTLVIAGGDFTSMHGKNAYRLASILKSSGDLSKALVGYNSSVYSVSVKNDSILTGGAYSASAYYSIYSAKITTANTVPNINFPPTNGYIRVAVPDGSGGYYVGGNFSYIGGIYQPNLAHINSSNQVVTAWAPQVNGEVRSIILSGTTLYIAGGFTSTNSATRQYISAIGTANPGSNKTWNSNLNSWAYSLAFDGTNVYAAGDFTTVNGSTTRNRLAKFDANGNLNGTWDPNANSTVQNIVISGSNILAGGNFTTMGTTSRNYLAKLNNTNGSSTNWATANSVVYSLFISGATCYVGGSFTQLTNTGGVASLRNYAGAVTISNGNIGTFNPGPNSTVLTINQSGTNIYFGGYFTTVNGTARNYLAAVNSSGTLQTWNPAPNSYVYSISVDAANIILGGNFSGFQEAARTYTSIVKYSSGLYAAWNPSLNSYVYDITYGTDKIFIGGLFTLVNGSSRNGLAAFNFKGNLQSFNLNLTKTGGGVTVNSLWATSTNLYVGGDFDLAGSTSRKDFVEANTSTGAIAATNASTDRNVYAIAVNGNTIVYGGAFNFSNVSYRNYLGIVRSSTGVVTPWNPLPDYWVLDIAYNYNKIFVVGYFDNVNSIQHTGAAAFNLTNGSLLSWNPQLSNGGNPVYADLESVAADSNNVYLGGYFDQVKGVSRINAAAVSAANASLLSWNPSPGPVGYRVRAIGFSSPSLLIGGDFSFCKGASRSFVAKIDSASGLVNSTWNPGTNGYVYAITGNGSNIYIGGNFSQLAATTRNSLGSVNASTGAITNFDPAVQTSGSPGTVNALAFDASNILYIGGYFNTVKGTTRNYAAAVNTSSVLQGWNPNLNGQVNALAVSGSNVILGGQFTTLNGGSAARNYLASVSTGGAVNAFNPNLNSYVYCLTLSGSTLYAGGSFTTVGGGSASRNYLASYDVSGTGTTLKTWNPSANSTVRGIASSSDTVYPGGYFTTINATTRNRLAGIRGNAGTSLLPFDPNADNVVWNNYQANRVLLVGGSFSNISGSTRHGFAVYKLPGSTSPEAQSEQYAVQSSLLHPFGIYPNPAATGRVTLQLGSSISGKCSVMITSLNGTRVYEKTVEPLNEFITLDLSALANGIYIVNVINDKTVWTTRLQIER